MNEHKFAQMIARKWFDPDTQDFAKCVGAILETIKHLRKDWPDNILNEYQPAEGSK